MIREKALILQLNSKFVGDLLNPSIVAVHLARHHQHLLKIGIRPFGIAVH